jgi:hypothetical protein
MVVSSIGHTWPGRLAGGTFALAGVGKLLAGGPYLTPLLLGEISNELRTLSFSVELAVPWVEVIVGTALMLRVGDRMAGLISLGLCGLFSIILLALPPGQQCSCFGLFGGIEHRGVHLLVLGALSLALVWHGRSRRRAQ